MILEFRRCFRLPIESRNPKIKRRKTKDIAKYPNRTFIAVNGKWETLFKADPKILNTHTGLNNPLFCFSTDQSATRSNFYDFVNKYRVEEFKKRVDSEKYNNLKQITACGIKDIDVGGYAHPLGARLVTI
jgi:hypothetical protein